MIKSLYPKTEKFRLNKFDLDFENIFGEVFSAKDSMNLLSQIWSLLEKGNLTSFRSEIEITQIYIRLFTVVGLMNEFFVTAWNEYATNDYLIWYYECERPPFHLGQLIGTDGEFNDYNYCDTDEGFYKNVLEKLILNEREKITKIIRKGFFNKNSIIFLEFWKGTCIFTNSFMEENLDYYDEVEPMEITTYDGDETEEEILNNLTLKKTNGLEWVEDEML